MDKSGLQLLDVAGHRDNTVAVMAGEVGAEEVGGGAAGLGGVAAGGGKDARDQGFELGGGDADVLGRDGSSGEGSVPGVGWGVQGSMELKLMGKTKNSQV